MYVYLIFLLAFFLVPLLAVVWIVGRDLIRYQRTLLWCLGFVYTIGWLWRKLPRQADSSKGDWPAAECLGRNVSGGTRPRLSWGRSPL